jgi:hypothetical protein
LSCRNRLRGRLLLKRRRKIEMLLKRSRRRLRKIERRVLIIMRTNILKISNYIFMEVMDLRNLRARQLKMTLNQLQLRLKTTQNSKKET